MNKFRRKLTVAAIGTIITILVSLLIGELYKYAKEILLDKRSIPSVEPPPLWDQNICWVAYSPTNYNPNKNLFPAEESIRSDLSLLQAKRF